MRMWAFRILFAGEMTQDRLRQLRQDLRLKPVGRLNDTEDAEFGYRQCPDTSELTLWRASDDRWELVLRHEVPLDAAAISAYRTETRAAIERAGLIFLAEADPSA